MTSRSASILIVGFALGAFLVTCSSKRDADVLAQAQAQSSDASGQAPPGIKKGVKVEFGVVGNYGAEVPKVSSEAYNGWKVVEEVKGNWVLIRCKPLVPEFNLPTDFWVNFNNVVQYRTKSD